MHFFFDLHQYKPRFIVKKNLIRNLEVVIAVIPKLSSNFQKKFLLKIFFQTTFRAIIKKNFSQLVLLYFSIFPILPFINHNL